MKKAVKLNDRKISDLIFFIALIIIPVIHFLIFYIGVNFNSILLALKTFDPETVTFYYSGFNNFADFIRDLFQDLVMRQSLINSVILYFVGLLIAFPLNVFISYMLYKQVPCTKVFRVILFLPQILSSIIMSTMFKFFVDRGLPSMLEMLFHIPRESLPTFLVDRSTAFGTIMFYGIWAGFGTQLIVYSSAMSRVPESLSEYGKLEGLSFMREFFMITLPLIFPSLQPFLIAGVAGFFTNQAHVFNFYGTGADYNLYTLGYLFFTRTVQDENTFVSYPYLAAGGLLFTAVAAPITLGLRRLLEKVAPAIEY